jgi:DNA-binding beta-propeller fold protein YncE
LAALTPTALPSPTVDASGVIHLPLPANGLVYDSQRNVFWASVPGNSGSAGNSVVSIDPGTGKVIDTIFAGSEPGVLALSGDGSHLFATLGGAPAPSLGARTYC